MPSSAAIVYESNKPFATLDEITSFGLWETLSSLGGLNKLQASLTSLSEITGSELSSLMVGSEFLVSVHVTSKNEFDFLYITHLKSLESHNQLSLIQDHFQPGTYKRKSRNYLGFKIIEISDGINTFAYLYHKNHIIGSFSAFLVEDAIRTISKDNTSHFLEQFPELSPIAKLEQDEGNLYVNLSAFNNLMDNFLSGTVPPLLGKSAFLDLTLSDKTISLSGFTVPEANQPSPLDPHLNIPPGTFQMGSIIPLHTSHVYHYSFEDPELWGSQHQNYLELVDKEAIASKQILKNAVDFDVNRVYPLLAGEIGLLHFQGLSETEKSLVLKVKDINNTFSFFDQVAERFAKANSDSLYTEYFEGKSIRFFNAPDFPQALLGSVATGFRNSYYTSLGDYLIFTFSLNQMKEIIQSYNNENTWLKSLRKNAFLEKVNQASNFSIFINTPDFWPQIDQHTSEYWHPYVNDHAELLKSFDNVGIQFSQVDGNFFTNIVVSQSEKPVSSLSLETPAQSLLFTSNIVTKPFLVKNHNDNSVEILLQDSTNILHLLDRDFKILWQKDLTNKVSSQFEQIDYYKNGRLQFVFVLDNQLHIIDRNGDNIPGFPTSIKGAKILKEFNVIDYDGSRNYRFTFTDGEGSIYLTNKEGETLEGWNPKNTGKPLVGPLQHKRIGKRDVMFNVQRSGAIQAFNRRGSRLSGFPLDVKIPVSDQYNILTSNDLKNSILTLVTVEGEVISIDMEGAIRQREQLYKTSANTQFEILNDLSGNYYLISAFGDQNWSVIDADGLVLFQKDYLEMTDSFQQFYRISAGKELIVFGESSLEKVYLFDTKGELITGAPLECSFPISLLYSAKTEQYDIYLSYENELRHFTIDAP